MAAVIHPTPLTLTPAELAGLRLKWLLDDIARRFPVEMALRDDPAALAAIEAQAGNRVLAERSAERMVVAQ